MANSLAASSQEYHSDTLIRYKNILQRSVKQRLCLVGSIIILLVVTIAIVVLLRRHQPTLVLLLYCSSYKELYQKYYACLYLTQVLWVLTKGANLYKPLLRFALVFNPSASSMILFITYIYQYILSLKKICRYYALLQLPLECLIYSLKLIQFILRAVPKF